MESLLFLQQCRPVQDDWNGKCLCTRWTRSLQLLNGEQREHALTRPTMPRHKQRFTLNLPSYVTGDVEFDLMIGVAFGLQLLITIFPSPVGKGLPRPFHIELNLVHRGADLSPISAPQTRKSSFDEWSALPASAYSCGHCDRQNHSPDTTP